MTNHGGAEGPGAAVPIPPPAEAVNMLYCLKIMG